MIDTITPALAEQFRAKVSIWNLLSFSSTPSDHTRCLSWVRAILTRLGRPMVEVLHAKSPLEAVLLGSKYEKLDGQPMSSAIQCTVNPGTVIRREAFRELEQIFDEEEQRMDEALVLQRTREALAYTNIPEAMAIFPELSPKAQWNQQMVAEEFVGSIEMDTLATLDFVSDQAPAQMETLSEYLNLRREVFGWLEVEGAIILIDRPTQVWQDEDSFRLTFDGGFVVEEKVTDQTHLHVMRVAKYVCPQDRGGGHDIHVTHLRFSDGEQVTAKEAFALLEQGKQLFMIPPPGAASFETHKNGPVWLREFSCPGCGKQALLA